MQLKHAACIFAIICDMCQLEYASPVASVPWQSQFFHRLTFHCNFNLICDKVYVHFREHFRVKILRHLIVSHENFPTFFVLIFLKEFS